MNSARYLLITNVVLLVAYRGPGPGLSNGFRRFRLFPVTADRWIWRVGRASCQHHTVLAALNIGAVLLGVAAGGLVASIAALVISGLLAVIGVGAGPDIGLVIGILGGLVAGGWVSGARSAHSHRFHGMVTGLALAFLVMVIARLGGSPAPTLTVVWLAILAVVVSGAAGWLAGRRRAV